MGFVQIEKHHFPEVARIYKEGLETGLATFETQVPSWEIWNDNHLPFARITIIENKNMYGWATLSQVSKRSVYKGVAEVSLYVSKESRGKGFGRKLLKELIRQSEINGIWTLQSGIMQANEASIQLHLDCGFRMIGFREKIGKLNDVWLDNVILERRSKIVGI